MPPIPPRRAPPAARRRWSWLARIAVVMAGLLVLAGGAIAVLVLAPPVELLKSRAIAEMKAKTGRNLTIGGPVSFTVYPSLTLRLEDVSLSGPPGMGDEPFAVVSSAEARVKLLPLLQRQIRLDQLILREPVFDLRVDKSGRRNWDFTPPHRTAALPPVRYAQVAPAPSSTGLPDAARDFLDNASNPDNPSPQTKLRIAALEELTLSDVRIERGSVQYTDERTGDSERVSAVEAVVTVPALQGQAEATGSATWSGQPVGFEVKLASPRALIEDRPVRLRVALKAAAIDARYEGALLVRNGVELDGELSAKGPSLRNLARWLGTELPPADGFGPHSLEGKLKVTSRGYHLSDAALSLDGATATGTLALDVSAQKPKVTANLKLSLLDLNRYTLAAATPATAPQKPAPAIVRPAVGQPVPAAKSIEDLINQEIDRKSGPKVKGYTAREGWSSEPLRLDVLGVADADVRLSVGGIHWRDIKIGQSIVTAALKSKVLRVNLDDMQLYGGKGRGVVTIDANSQMPVYGANISAEGVAGQPLLKDAVGFGLVSGTAKVQLAVGAQGSSELQLVESMNGKADVQIADGAVQGMNIAGALRALKGGQLQALNKAPTEKTDFSELQATFAIKNGVASNQDLRMFGPLLRVGGAGQIALPSRSIDYTLRPRLVASIEGQGAADKGATDKLTGIEVPLRIVGPLSDPDIKPDVDGLLKDPAKTVETVKEIGKQLKGSELFKSLMGRGKTAPPAEGGESAPPPNPKAEVKKLLDGVLGR